MKPTVGLISRHLVIPISEHQDSAGPMTRTVKDAAYLLQAIAGVDPHDNYTQEIPYNVNLPDYVEACKATALKGARLGVPRNVIQAMSRRFSGPELAAFEKALALFKGSGAVVVDNTDFEDPAGWLNRNPEESILGADFVPNLEHYLMQLKTNPNNITDLSSLREFTRNTPQEQYPTMNTAIWDNILDAQKWTNRDSQFREAYATIVDYATNKGLLMALKKWNLDAIVLPTFLSSSWTAGIGTPIITVPLGAFPKNSKIELNRRREMVEKAPGIP
jgi:amidase